MAPAADWALTSDAAVDQSWVDLGDYVVPETHPRQISSYELV
jgi:hypothetical protein